MASDHVPTTSPTLLRLLGLPGNDEAWTAFVEKYNPLIEDRCRRAGLQPADVEDVGAEVRLKLIEAMKGFQYDPARRFRGYLKTVVDSVIRSNWRLLKRRPGWVGRGGDGDDSVPEPLASLGAELDDEIRSRVDDLQRALDRVRFEVGPENWRVFELTAGEGLTGAEAAERLGKSIAAVYMTKSRVKDRLQVATGVKPGG